MFRFKSSTPSFAPPPPPPAAEDIEADLAAAPVDDVVFLTAVPLPDEAAEDEDSNGGEAESSRRPLGQFELVERFLHLKKVQRTPIFRPDDKA